MANASLSAFSFSGFFFISAMRTEEYLARVFWLGEDGGAPYKIQNPNENNKVFNCFEGNSYLCLLETAASDPGLGRCEYGWGCC